MFSLTFTPSSPGGNWEISGSRLVSPGAWIEPFDHPMVELRAVACNGRLGVAIFERPFPDGGWGACRLTLHTGADLCGEFQQLYDFTRQWPLHWFWIEIDGDQVSIESSPRPTAPVFTADNRHRVLVDWDPLKLYPFVDPVLDQQLAAYYLVSFEQPYGPQTIVRQIRQVSAGYRAAWRDRQGWEFFRPAAAAPDYPRILCAKAAPVRSMDALLTETLARLLPNQKTPVAVGLSGGLDSSAVAAAAARRGHPTATYGLLMPGPDGAHQQARREAAIALFRLKDCTFRGSQSDQAAGEYGHSGNGRMVPWEELHYDHFDRLYAAASNDGHDVFLSGFGGDELCMPYWDELPDRQTQMAALLSPGDLPGFLPPAVTHGQTERIEEIMSTPTHFAQRSVMEAISGSAAQCMRNGLWPIHLLAEQETVKYCHALPTFWRNGRRLMRELLAHYDFPAIVTHPGVTETFCDLSRHSLMQCAIGRDSFKTPRLADHGFINQKELSVNYKQWKHALAPEGWDIHFIAAAVLEATLISIEKARVPTHTVQ